MKIVSFQFADGSWGEQIVKARSENEAVAKVSERLRGEFGPGGIGSWSIRKVRLHNA